MLSSKVTFMLSNTLNIRYPIVYLTIMNKSVFTNPKTNPKTTSEVKNDLLYDISLLKKNLEQFQEFVEYLTSYSFDEWKELYSRMDGLQNDLDELREDGITYIEMLLEESEKPDEVIE